jgi:ribose transport system ATP-binding protein
MIELRNISKSFPGVKSLDRVHFRAMRGEVHALLGENGAGKSTLSKIMVGVHAPDEGELRFDAQLRRWSGPAEAKDAGIHVIHQELQLFPELTVAENLFIGQEPRNRLGLLDRARMRALTREAMQRLGSVLDPGMRVADLSVADQQMVEIAKALLGEVKLLILDEPTASLSGREVQMLFACIRHLRAQGVCVIYISHRLEEIEEICDRLTVLKDGRWVGTRSVAETPRRTMVSMMVGRELQDIFPPRGAVEPGRAPVLEVRSLASAPRVVDVSLVVRPGEIVGLAGLMGSGRTEAAHAMFGSAPRQRGTVRVDGKTLAAGSVRESITAGFGLLTEDRKSEGLLMRHSIAANVTAPVLERFTRFGLVDRPAERAVASEDIARLRIAAPSPCDGVSKLSGGNQQKILLARWFRACHKVLILDEPTRGVDIGAKVEIYGLIRELADQGIGVLVISSEMQEVIGLCSRIVVMRQGRSVGELTGDAISEEAVMSLAAMGQGEEHGEAA